MQVVVVAEEALVVLADVAVGGELQLEVPDRLQTRTGVEILAVRFRVLVVQIGLLDQPTIRRSLLGKGAISEAVSIEVGALVAQQKRQSRRTKISVEAAIIGLLGIPW